MVFRAADGENLVILACTVFDWSTCDRQTYEEIELQWLRWATAVPAVARKNASVCLRSLLDYTATMNFDFLVTKHNQFTFVPRRITDNNSETYSENASKHILDIVFNNIIDRRQTYRQTEINNNTITLEAAPYSGGRRRQKW